MKSLKKITIIPLVNLYSEGAIGPTVRRPKRHEFPDWFRLIATVHKLDLAKSGIKEIDVPIAIDDFYSFEDAESFAARMVHVFPKMVRSGSSDIGQAIRLAVAASFEVEVNSIQARSRKRTFVKPRHATSYLGRAIRSNNGDDALSLVQVGEITGRDHTTVMSSVEVASILIDRRDRCRDYDDFARRLYRAERTLRCAGFGFQHDVKLATKLGA